MKSMIRTAVLGLGVLAAGAHAQAIYKCVVNGSVTYQQEPCPLPPPPVIRPGMEHIKTQLIGQWHSDHDLTMAWLRQHTKLEKKQDAFLDQLTGHMTLTFTRDHVTTDIPDLKVLINGKSFPMKATHNDEPYSVVSASPKLVKVSDVDHATGGTSTDDFNFEGSDIMWVPMDSGHQLALDPASREYFRRVK